MESDVAIMRGRVDLGADPPLPPVPDQQAAQKRWPAGPASTVMAQPGLILGPAFTAVLRFMSDLLDAYMRRNGPALT
jgi:hypothetical protein